MPQRLLDSVRSGFGFLTTIPVGFNQAALDSLAKRMWICVLVGAVIGLLVGGISYALTFVPNMSGFVHAALTLVTLYAVTGFIHLDGLADVGDGLLKHGTTRERLRVIKDPNIGVGGIAFCVLAFLLLFSAVASLKSTALVSALVTAEVAAKLSMVEVASLGRATHQGLGSLFAESSGLFTLAVALVIAALLTVLCLGLRGLLVLLPPLVLSFGLVQLANRAFGGINGDVIGAANELGRLVALITISFL